MSPRPGRPGPGPKSVRGAGGGAAVFRGIPFAEPPVGALRFAAPRPVRRWDGVRPAVPYGPPPPQSSVSGVDAPARVTAGDGGLTVNVWSPEPAAGAGLPVVVWTPGVGYVIGASISRSSTPPTWPGAASLW
ncbi:carboxylesterase family protein [Streptomyces sp. NPDC057617]|uniref:carboxylesterase family protein n=1 Tax=Streptomyces sp. NPDC057617 TaxID=3346184 RepID=UPI0036C38D07